MALVSLIEDDNMTSPPKSKRTKHVWSDSEDILILRQFRFMEVERISANKRGAIWREIALAMEKVNFAVSERSVRDRMKTLLDTFQKNNPKDEWKTGDPEGYSVKEKLLLEICQAEEEAERRRTQLNGLKDKKDEKRDRMEAKLMIAAKHSQKKRQKGGAGDDEEPGRPPKTRNRFQSTASEYFEAKRLESVKKMELEERRLALDEAKYGLEKAREERMLADSLELRAQNAALLKRIVAQELRN